MASELEVSEVIVGAMAIYPNFKYGPGVTAKSFAAAWWRHVGHLPADALQSAMDRAVHGTEFFPTVHDVLRAHAELAAGAGRTGLEAWHDMGVAVIQHGHNDPPGKNWKFDDPIVTEAAIALGWRTYCMSDEDSLRWAFAKIYDALRARAVSRHMDALPAPEVRKALAP